MIDSHCHLDSKQFSGRVDEMVSAAEQVGVTKIINVGIDLPTSRESVSLAESYSQIYATVGCHPHEAKTLTAEVLREIEELLSHPKVVAVGEIGLDYYRDLSPRSVQRRVFHEQLTLAERTKYPVVIHVRESFSEALAIVSEHRAELGDIVFHCFSEGLDQAKEVLDLDCHLAVGGAATFKNSVMSDVAGYCPLDRLLLETDAPYLTPVPFRGKLNQPAYVRYVRDHVASVRGVTPAEIEKATDRTSAKFYRLVETFG